MTAGVVVRVQYSLTRPLETLVRISLSRPTVSELMFVISRSLFLFVIVVKFAFEDRRTH